MRRLSRLSALSVRCSLLLLLLLLPRPLTAGESITCPIGGGLFEIERGSVTQEIGQRLDLRPIGASPAVPLPPPLPICPDNGFVLFKEAFSPEEVALYTPIVASEAYRKLVAENRPAGHRVAALLEAAGERDPAAIAYFWLRAAWESELSNPPAMVEYYRRAAGELQRSLPIIEDQDQRLFTQLLIANLLRQTGDLPGAARALAAVPEALPQGVVLAVRGQVANLIAAGNTQPAPMVLPP